MVGGTRTPCSASSSKSRFGTRYHAIEGAEQTLCRLVGYGREQGDIMSKVLVNVGMTLDGYMAPEGMNIAHADDPEHLGPCARVSVFHGLKHTHGLAP